MQVGEGQELRVEGLDLSLGRWVISALVYRSFPHHCG